MKISEIKEVLRAEVLSGEDQLDINISGAGGADLMSDVLAAVAEGSTLMKSKEILSIRSGPTSRQ